VKDLVRHLEGHTFTWMPWKDARAEYAQFRGEHGAKAVATPLLTYPDDNAKFKKTEAPMYGLSLAQANSSLEWNTCRFSTAKCREGCVSFAGKGELASVQAGRIRKTLFLAEHTDAFYTLLIHELERVSAKHKHAQTFRVRLNTFSDIPWERMSPNLFAMFPRMRFFDYTKWWERAVDANLGWYGWPGNYRLIYSASEMSDDSDVVNMVDEGMNTAVVFKVKKGVALPSTWHGIPVADGDLGDDRWSDQRGIIVGLRAKGRMRFGAFDGFVRDPNPERLTA
jgi:hypothetical protein